MDLFGSQIGVFHSTVVVHDYDTLVWPFARLHWVILSYSKLTQIVGEILATVDEDKRL